MKTITIAAFLFGLFACSAQSDSANKADPAADIASKSATKQEQNLMAQKDVLPAEARGQSAFSEDPNRQFDFWIGEWDVNLRMLQADFSWKDSVAAKASIYPILNGKAILELWDSEPIKGYSLRFYDAEKEKWVLWLNWPGENRSTASSLEGAFRHGRGDFFKSYEDPEGESIVQRYSFNDIYANSLRWDDLYSKDGGETWRKNWRMEWTRQSQEPNWPIEGETAHTFDEGARCSEPQFRVHEFLAGPWAGEMELGGETKPAEMRGYKILGGCAVMAFVRADSREWFFFNFHNTAAKKWESHFLSDQRGEDMIRLYTDENNFSLKTKNGARAQVWMVEENSLIFSSTGGPEGPLTLRLIRE